MDNDVKMSKLEKVNQQDSFRSICLGNSGGFKRVVLNVSNKYFSLYKFHLVGHLSPLTYQLRYFIGPMLFIPTYSFQAC